MAGNRNSGMGSPLCSGVCAFYLPPRSYSDEHLLLLRITDVDGLLVKMMPPSWRSAFV